MLRYAFRLHRWGMVGFGITLAVTTYAQAAIYPSAAGTTAASKAAFVHSMRAIATQLSYLLPPPYRLDTLAGYVQWRAYGGLSLVVAVWAVAAAAAAVRGDEEKQLVDMWLAEGLSRARLVAARLAAFAAAALVASVTGGLGVVLGAAGHESIDLTRLAGQAFALWLLTVTCFALCYLVSQVPASVRAAQAAAAVTLLVLYLVDATARSQHSLDAVSWVSPFKWYEATDVLAPGGHLDIAGLALSVAVTFAAGCLAALAFAYRDVRGPLFLRHLRETEPRDVPPSPALSWPVGRLLYQQRWLVLAWALISVLLAVFMIEVARGLVDNLTSIPGLRADLARGGSDPYQAFVALFWFGIAQLLLAGFAIHIVSVWASEDTQGVLEMILSMPRPRWSVVLERAGMAIAAIALVVAASSAVVAMTAAAIGINLNASGVLRASLLLIPFALTFTAVGAAGSARWPRAVVGVLGLLAMISYLTWELAPLMSWPAWVADLSVFKLYGTPLTSGVYWTGLWAMLGVVVAGFGLATVLMQRREVGR